MNTCLNFCCEKRKNIFYCFELQNWLYDSESLPFFNPSFFKRRENTINIPKIPIKLKMKEYIIAVCWEKNK